jgi:hypothetical protein
MVPSGAWSAEEAGAVTEIPSHLRATAFLPTLRRTEITS